MIKIQEETSEKRTLMQKVLRLNKEIRQRYLKERKNKVKKKIRK